MHNPQDFAFQPAGDSEWYFLDTFAELVGETIPGTMLNFENRKRPIKTKGDLLVTTEGIQFIGSTEPRH